MKRTKILRILEEDYPLIEWDVEEIEYCWLITAKLGQLRKAIALPKMLLNEAIYPNSMIYCVGKDAYRAVRNKFIELDSAT